jgi:hypothetical protein
MYYDLKYQGITFVVSKYGAHNFVPRSGFVDFKAVARNIGFKLHNA